MSELVEKYGANMKALLDQQVIDAGRFNGGLYAIPARRVVIAQSNFFIREDWLDKLGMETPTTKEELINVLRAFRDNDINGDGDPSNEIPWAVASDLRLGAIAQKSFLKDLSPRTLACVPAPYIEGYKDYALFMNQLYNEGLLSPDFALDKSELLFNDITAGKAGMYEQTYDNPICVSPGILAALQAYEPEAKLTPFSAFESMLDPTKHYHSMYGAHGLLNFIPIYSQQPEAAIMYLDWLCKFDTIYFLQNGVEGITYDLNADGIPVVKNPDDANHDKFQSCLLSLSRILLHSKILCLHGWIWDFHATFLTVL